MVFMKTPKIIFRYSWIYDEMWKETIKDKKEIRNYPSPKKILNYIKKIERLWQEYEKKIFSELSKITGLKWKSEYIPCYIIGQHHPFSDPLTMPVYKRQDWFIDTLIHELIHQLFIQNGNIQQSKKAWAYIFRKYRKQSHTTAIHIPLHAIHSHIYLKFYGEKRLKRNIRIMNAYLDYRNSWQIVQKEGYQNIIQEFIKRIE